MVEITKSAQERWADGQKFLTEIAAEYDNNYTQAVKLIDNLERKARQDGVQGCMHPDGHCDETVMVRCSFCVITDSLGEPAA